MSRSRRRISEDNAAIARCRTIITRAMKDSMNRDAASIAARIQGNGAWSSAVERDRQLLRYLWCEGLKSEIRDALKKWGFGEDNDKPPQLNLFPEEERAIVRNIGLARIWLPRLNAHVSYHDLSDADLLASAAYYRGQITGLTRTASGLERLAALRIARKDQAA